MACSKVIADSGCKATSGTHLAAENVRGFRTLPAITRTPRLRNSKISSVT
jgi:hypothetical protein